MHSIASSPHRSRWSVIIAALGVALVATLLFVAAAPSPAAAQPNGETCYAVSDLGGNDQGTADNLISITNGAVSVIGAMGTNDSEAFAIRPGDTGYAWSGADGAGLVTVDLATGATAAAFAVPGPKIEGLTWANTADNDLTNDILYVVRLNGDVQGYTPAGAAAGISANVLGGGYNEGTDIAWDPVDDQLYVIRTTTSAGAMPDQTQIVTVSPAVAVVGESAEDLEGLGFLDDGTMIGTTGDDGASADNLYVVSQANGTVGASLADLSSSIDNEDVDCISPELAAGDPGVLTAAITGECIDNDGKITATVTYASGDEPANYSVAITNQTTQTGTLNSGDAPAMVMTGADLADGDYTVTVTNTTSNSVLVSQAVTVDCDAAADGVLGLAISDVCEANDGKITVEVSYVSGVAAADYSVTVQGQAPRTGTLNAGDAPASEMFTGLADGTYNIVVNNTSTSTQVGAADVVVACDPTEPPSASVTVECVEGAGKATVLLFNPTGATVMFSADVLGVQETNSLNPAPTFINAGSVIINEFMADNETSLVDGAGMNVDWIELYNPTGAAVDLSGWSITDDDGDPTKQVFAAGTAISAGGYLYVFQGDGNPGPAGPTFDFGLGGGGEFLGLYDGAGTVMSAYTAEYPDQFTDVSYGLGSDGSIGYFETPSIPGNSANGIPSSTVPMAMEMFTGLPDGSTPVVVTADGQQIAVAGSPATVACDTGEVTVSTVAECSGNDGQIVTTVNNSTGAAVTVTITYSAPGGPVQTATVAANSSSTIRRTGRTDGDYTATITVDGVQVAAPTVTVECDPDVPVENPAVTIEKTVNGALADAAPGPSIVEGQAVNYGYIVTNSGDTTLTNVAVTDSDAGLTIDCGGSNVIASMAPQAVVNCTASTTALVGLVSTTATAASGAVTASDPAFYTGTALPVDNGDITFTFDNRCVAGNGAFYFVITNTTAAPATAVLKVTGLADRTITVPANSTATAARTGRPDNTYTVELLINGTSVSSTSEVVACDGGPVVTPTPTPIVTPTPNPVPTGEIGDKVFLDADKDGIQDAGEAGLPGVNVNLWTDDDGNGTPDTQVAATTTVAGGAYLFDGLDVSKTYLVQVLAGSFSISPQNAAADTIDSDADPATGITGPITLNANEFDNTVDIGLFDGGDIITEFVNDCVGGNGRLYIFVTNNTLNAVPASLAVTGLADKTATVEPGTRVFLARTGRPDGQYQVVATVNGATVLSQTETVACDAPVAAADGLGLALALTSGPTENADGTFSMTYSYLVKNTTNQQINLSNLDYGLSTTYGAGLVSQTVTNSFCNNASLAVNATCTDTVNVVVNVNDDPGPFLVSGIVQGTAADGTAVSDISQNGTNVDPDNDGPGDNSVPTPAIFPGATSYVFENTCLGGNGAFIFQVTNGSLTDVVATMEVANVQHPAKVVTIAGGTTGRVAVTGRPDNSYQVDFKIDGVVVFSETVEVTCDVIFGSGTAVISEVQCVSGSEGVRLSYQHLGGDTPVTFVVTQDNATVRTVTLEPGDATVFDALAPLTVGTATTITITGDGVQPVIKTITPTALSCAGALSASATVSCVARDGILTVGLTHGGGTLPTSYRVEVNATNRTGSVAVGASANETFTGLVDTTYTVVVRNLSDNNVVVFNEQVPVSCDQPLKVSAAAACAGSQGEIAFTLLNNGNTPIDYEVKINNTARMDTINPGETLTETIRQLINTTFAVSATNLTDNVVIIDEMIPVACAQPLTITTASACVGGAGEITFTIVNDAATAVDYQVKVNNTVRNATVQPGATVTQVMTGLVDFDYSVEASNRTDDPDVVVLSETVTVDCV